MMTTNTFARDILSPLVPSSAQDQQLADNLVVENLLTSLQLPNFDSAVVTLQHLNLLTSSINNDSIMIIQKVHHHHQDQPQNILDRIVRLCAKQFRYYFTHYSVASAVDHEYWPTAVYDYLHLLYTQPQQANIST